MILTTIGVIALLAPFLILFKYKERISSFSLLCAGIIITQLLIGIITQSLGIFNFISIVSITIIFDMGLALYFKPWLHFSIKKISFDPTALIIFFIALMYLGMANYSYTGAYSTILTDEYKTTKNLSYSFPYFADEWYAVAFIQDAIEHNSLPLFNPLEKERSYFHNFELAFHSFLAELTLLLNLDPLMHYKLFSIIFNALIILLLYLLLRVHGISQIPATTASLLALFITNGATHPGLWYFIPLSMGIVALLIFFIKLTKKNHRGIYLSLLLTLLFYPPLFIFSSVAYLFYILNFKNITNKKKLDALITYGLLVFFIALQFSAIQFFNSFHLNWLIFILIYWVIIIKLIITKDLQYSNKKLIAHSIIPFLSLLLLLSSFLIPSLAGIKKPFLDLWNILSRFEATGDFLIQLKFFDVLPLLTILGAGIGTITLFKKNEKKWIIITTLSGLLIWLLYAQTNYRFIIEYQRVVFVTSLLFALLSGFGFNYIYTLIINKLPQIKNKERLVQMGLIILFLSLLPSYTSRDEWRNLAYKNKETGQLLLPAAPANTYLHPDDIVLFSDIHNELFLSLTWKGTVLGIVTNNFPLAIKSGTISMNTQLPGSFQAADCEKKLDLLHEYKVSYVYFPEFKCDGFEILGQSSEGIALYKIE